MSPHLGACGDRHTRAGRFRHVATHTFPEHPLPSLRRSAEVRHDSEELLHSLSPSSRPISTTTRTLMSILPPSWLSDGSQAGTHPRSPGRTDLATTNRRCVGDTIRRFLNDRLQKG